MLDKMFWGFMSVISTIIKFIVVGGILGFIIILPFVINGGWLFGIILYIGVAVWLCNLFGEKGKGKNGN